MENFSRSWTALPHHHLKRVYFCLHFTNPPLASISNNLHTSSTCIHSLTHTFWSLFKDFSSLTSSVLSDFLKFCQLSCRITDLQWAFQHLYGTLPSYSEEFVPGRKCFGIHNIHWHFTLQKWTFSHLYFITAYRVFLDTTKENKRGSPEDQEVEKGTRNSLLQGYGHMWLPWHFYIPYLREVILVPN